MAGVEAGHPPLAGDTTLAADLGIADASREEIYQGDKAAGGKVNKDARSGQAWENHRTTGVSSPSVKIEPGGNTTGSPNAQPPLWRMPPDLSSCQAFDHVRVANVIEYHVNRPGDGVQPGHYAVSSEGVQFDASL